MVKTIVSGIAVIITFIAFYPYLKAILSNKIKPHFFSWIIWGVTTLIAFLGQVSGNGGVGTISMGISSIITFYIAYLTFRRRGDLSVRTVDWVYLILAAFSIPVWIITNDPLWAVVIMTGIDLLGFGPTFRNAYENPSNEDPIFYLIFTFRNLLAIYALETYSVTTILFPAAISIAGVFVAVIVLARKKKLNIPQ